MHRYYNKYGALPWRQFDICLWKWLSADLQWVTAKWWWRALQTDGWELATSGVGGGGLREWTDARGVFCAALYGCSFLSFLVFPMDGITPEQRRNLYCALIIPEYLNRAGTDLRFQNKHCSRTDCVPGYTASANPDSSFSSFQDIPKPASPSHLPWAMRV